MTLHGIILIGSVGAVLIGIGVYELMFAIRVTWWRHAFRSAARILVIAMVVIGVLFISAESLLGYGTMTAIAAAQVAIPVMTLAAILFVASLIPARTRKPQTRRAPPLRDPVSTRASLHAAKTSTASARVLRDIPIVPEWRAEAITQPPPQVIVRAGRHITDEA